MRFCDVLEATDQLTLEEQEELADIVRKRAIAKRRAELLNDLADSDKEFAEGRCRVSSADEIVAGIFS